jgi:hypothetical protein
MSWLHDSIMHRRGVAQGRVHATHALTEAKQGTYHYTIGPYSQPVLTVRPGDRVVVETRDAFEGKVRTTQDLPSRVLTMPFVNPQNGPILVEGAEKGDVLAVCIESMAPRGPNPRGTCAMIPFFGALSATSMTAMLHEALPELQRGRWAATAEELVPHLGRLVDAGDVVLVKGSKGSRISLVVDAIRKLGQQAPAPDQET